MSVNRWPRRVQNAGVLLFWGVVAIALGFVVDDIVTLIARMWISF